MESGRPTKKPTCSKCGKTFKRFQGLGNHERYCVGGKPERLARRGYARTGSRLVRALARKRDKLREKGMAFLAVAGKIDLMIGALKGVE